MELKDFKLPEGVEVDFKQDTISDEEKSFSDYFNSLPGSEKDSIFKRMHQLYDKTLHNTQDVDYTLEYETEENEEILTGWDEDDEREKESFLDKITKIFSKMFGVKQ